MNQHTLGSRGQVYVTRAAAVAYMTLCQSQFEQARRALTERLLSARPDPRCHGCYLLDANGQNASRLRVFVIEEGALQVVTKLMIADDG